MALNTNNIAVNSVSAVSLEQGGSLLAVNEQLLTLHDTEYMQQLREVVVFIWKQVNQTAHTERRETQPARKMQNTG